MTRRTGAVRRRIVGGVLAVCALLMTAGCGGKSDGSTGKAGESGGAGADASKASPDKLVMGLIPDESNQTMIKEFTPLQDYLAKKLGRKVEILTVTDYSGVIEAMRKKRVDLAWFGPLSYVLAEQEAKAEAIAVGVNGKGQTTYHSVIVVPGGSPAQKLEDLAGKSFAFVDPASTSGHLMPAYLIKQKTGKTADQFFGKISYAGGHDAVEAAVKNKAVDGGADDDITYKRQIDAKLITPQTNRILFTSPDIPGSPIACRGDLDPQLKQQVQQALLSAHTEIKQLGMDTTRYVAASPKDYQMVRDMVKSLGLQKEQMLK